MLSPIHCPATGAGSSTVITIGASRWPFAMIFPPTATWIDALDAFFALIVVPASMVSVAPEGTKSGPSRIQSLSQPSVRDCATCPPPSGPAARPALGFPIGFGETVHCGGSGGASVVEPSGVMFEPPSTVDDASSPIDPRGTQIAWAVSQTAPKPAQSSSVAH